MDPNSSPSFDCSAVSYYQVLSLTASLARCCSYFGLKDYYCFEALLHTHPAFFEHLSKQALLYYLPTSSLEQTQCDHLYFAEFSARQALDLKPSASP